MITSELKNCLMAFADRIEVFYGMQMLISESISTDRTNFDRHFTTSGRFEIKLLNVTWRISGGRMIFSQVDMYYEIAIDNLSDFWEEDDNCFEFLEKYGESVYRKTTLKFKTASEHVNTNR